MSRDGGPFYSVMPVRRAPSGRGITGPVGSASIAPVVLRPGGNAQALLTWRVNMDPPTPFNPAIVHITSPDEHAYLRGDVPGHPLASSLPPAGRGKNVTASRRMPPPGIHLEKQALARFRHPRMPGPAAGAAHGYHRWNRYADASVFPR